MSINNNHLYRLAAIELRVGCGDYRVAINNVLQISLSSPGQDIMPPFADSKMTISLCRAIKNIADINNSAENKLHYFNVLSRLRISADATRASVCAGADDSEEYKEARRRFRAVIAL